MLPNCLNPVSSLKCLDNHLCSVWLMLFICSAKLLFLAFFLPSACRVVAAAQKVVPPPGMPGSHIGVAYWGLATLLFIQSLALSLERAQKKPQGAWFSAMPVDYWDGVFSSCFLMVKPWLLHVFGGEGWGRRGTKTKNLKVPVLLVLFSSIFTNSVRQTKSGLFISLLYSHLHYLNLVGLKQ